MREDISSQNLQFWVNECLENNVSADLPGVTNTLGHNIFDTRLVHLTPVLSNKLVQMCKGDNLNLYAFLLSSVSLAVNVFSGESKFRIAIDNFARSANTGHRNESVHIGCVIDRNKSFKELFASHQDKIKAALEHSEFDNERLIQKLNAKGITWEDCPFFISMNNDSKEKLSRPFNILTSLNGESLQLEICFLSEKYSSYVIEEFLNKILLILSEAIEAPGTVIRVLLGPTREQVTALISQAGELKSYPFSKTIVDIFEQTTYAHPDAVAYWHNSSRLSYQELNELSNRVALYLRNNHQIKPNDVIGVLLEPSRLMVIALIGILKSGGAYLPLAPEFPENRKKDILLDAKVKLVLTESQFLLEAMTYEEPLLVLDIQLPEMDICEMNPYRINSSSDLAYVIYTSGSTGQPQGVMVEHQGIVNMICDQISILAINSDDKILNMLPFTFDVAHFHLFLCVFSGATFVQIDKAKTIDPKSFLHYLEDAKVSIAGLPPAYLNTIDLTSLSNLRIVYTGGESPEASKIQDLLNGKITVFNQYGLTETSCSSLLYKVQNIDSSGIIPIGRTIANNRVYILNDDMQFVPNGVIGEIYLAGIGVARGYFNNPELTNVRFSEDPFWAGERMYKTGDLGLRLPDGNIIFKGRRDSQIKIRGNRVEITEIEKLLHSHEQICQVLVMAGASEQLNDNFLTAYIQISSKNTDQEKLIRDFLAAHLPSFMIPSFFIFLEAFPLTPNGKIDKKALPNPLSKENSKISVHGPRTPTEVTMVKIWEEVLGRTDLDIHDDFFMIGGQSLKATRVIARIYDLFKCEVELGEVFSHPTIAQLSDIIDSVPLKSGLNQILPLDKDDLYDVSRAQKRMWVLQNVEPNSIAYNLKHAVRINGPLNRVMLEKAFLAVLSRHEILRTTFLFSEDGLKQKIHGLDETEFAVTYIDLRDSDINKKVIEIENEFSSRVFDLEKGPLFEVGLLHLRENENVVIINMHHIISDGWSLKVLMEELISTYDNLMDGLPGEKKTLPFQYKDFSAWQNDQLKQNKETQKHKEYWMNQFSAEIPILDFPTDYIRPQVKTFNGRSVNVLFATGQVSTLRTLCAKEQTSIFSILFAGVYALLNRYTGQGDIVIGTPVAGRNFSSLENQIGLYLNTLAIRTVFNGDDPFLKLFQQVKQVLADGFAHQVYPFDELVDEIQIPRDISRSPLFDVMVVMQPDDKSPDTRAELSIESFGTSSRISKFDLVFVFSEREDGMRLQLQYNSDLFELDTAQRLLTHYQRLMSCVMRDIQCSIDQIDLIDAHEKKDILDLSNGPAVQYPDVTLQALFETQVINMPEAIAIQFENISLTYSELNSKANQFAHYLRVKYKISSGDMIAICMDRSEMMYIALWGIIKSGAGYVPIDPNFPALRFNYIIDDANVKVCLCEESGKEFLKKTNIPFLNIRTAWREIDKYVNTNIHPINSIDSIAYAIYTSGSTGNPKGVLIAHSGIVNRIYWMWTHYNFNSQDVFFQKTPIVFDVSVWELFMPLCFGAKLVLCRQEVIHDPQLIVEHIYRYGVTAIHFVPSMLNAFLNELTLGYEKKISTLKYVFSSGETLLNETASKCRRMLNFPVHNLYGPTEASVDVSYFNFFELSKKLTNNVVPIGRPISNIGIYVLDERLEVVPIGVRGELYLSGIGLAQGYLNKPELTSQTFIDNPFKPSTPMYKTGDIGRYLMDGNIEFIGRKDLQVKIRGHRIELSEVENFIAQFPGVNEVVVADYKEENGDKQLLAYLANSPGIVIEELREFLLQRVPDYMIPSRFIKIDGLERTASGKIDRKSLPKPEQNMELSMKYRAPSTSVEFQLAVLWKNILKREVIGIDDSFFLVGGDSMKAIRLVGAINQNFKKQLEVKDIFRYQTIATLSSFIDQLQPGDRHEGSRELVLQKINNVKESIQKLDAFNSCIDIYPMSDIEIGMVYYNEMDERSNAYHDQFYYHIEDPSFNFELFRRAFSLMISKHDILRTSFHISEFDFPVQAVHSDTLISPQISFTSLVSLAPDDQRHYLKDLQEGDYRSRFVISEPCLFRMKICRLSKTEYSILWSFHHAILDGWSNASFITELSNAYYDLKNNPSHTLTSLKGNYKDFIIDQELVKNSIETREYWKSQLKGYTRTGLPLGKLADAITGNKKGKSGFRSLSLSDDLIQEIKGLSDSNKVTLKTVCFAAFLQFIRNITDTDDITIGMVTSGRPEIEDGEKILGCFLNTVPFRFNKNFDSSIDLIKTVNQGLNELKGHDKLSLFEIKSLLKVKHGTENPFFDITFSYVDFYIYKNLRTDLIGKKSTVSGYEETNTPFDFTIVGGEKIKAEIFYSAELFTIEEIDQLLTRYVDILTKFVSNSNQLISHNTALEKLTAIIQEKVEEKIDEALPDGSPTQILVSEDEDNTSERLVAIWEKVFDRKPIGVHDNFFELGGHSLKAIQIFYRIGKEFNLKIEFKTIFTHPSIAELTQIINAHRWMRSESNPDQDQEIIIL